MSQSESGAVGKTCAYCGASIGAITPSVICSQCQAVHHAVCWRRNGRCTTADCAGTPISTRTGAALSGGGVEVASIPPAAAPTGAPPSAVGRAQPEAPVSRAPGSERAPAGRMAASRSATSTAMKAGFWSRWVASLIDGVILAVPRFVLGLVTTRSAASQLALLIFAAYSVALIGSQGCTVGMMAMRLTVVRTDGSKVDYLWAFIRLLGSILSALPFCLGYLWIAWDPEKQAWHDKIARTYVVKT